MLVYQRVSISPPSTLSAPKDIKPPTVARGPSPIREPNQRDNKIDTLRKNVSSFFWCSKTRLVGGFIPFQKYEFVNWDDDIPN